MSVSGLCQICQSAEADVQCDRCGTLVCSDHFNREAAVCVECAAEMGVSEGGPASGDTEDHPDVDEHQF